MAARINPERRALFETFAPPTEMEPDRERAERLIEFRVTVTPLLAHSRAGQSSGITRAKECVSFVRVLGRLLRMV